MEAEFLDQRGVPPQATDLFKHALIQDAAYQSLLRSTRQQHQQRIAQVWAERFPELAETQPALWAHPSTEAGLREQAIPYWQRAGERATQRSANLEAIAHLTKGLALLKTLPDPLERRQQALRRQIPLGTAFMLTKGFAAPAVEHTDARAQELCQQVGETRQLFPVLRGLLHFYYNRGEWQSARERAAQLLRLAPGQQDSALLLEAHSMLALTLFPLGEVPVSRAHAEQGIAMYTPQQPRLLTFRCGEAPGLSCLAFAAMALWWLGYPDQASNRSRAAFSLAQELAQPLSLAWALRHAAWLHQWRREAQASQEWAEAGIALSTEQGFAYWLALGTVQRGGALAEQGQAAEGMAQISQGIAAYRAIGAERVAAPLLGFFAEAHGKAGQAAEGLAAVAEALAVLDKTGERWWEAELYRLTGELRRRQGEAEAEVEVDACFHQALAIARRQQAKSLELRAAMSLSRLWQQQGKRAEARERLAPVYGWFTEGFDTGDHHEARALLEELRS